MSTNSAFAQDSSGLEPATLGSEYRDDIDWFWFTPPPDDPNAPPAAPQNCPKAAYSTFSWHYARTSDSLIGPGPTPTSQIRDYVNWVTRPQRLSGPCWAFAMAAVIDIKYKILFDRYDLRDPSDVNCRIFNRKTNSTCVSLTTPLPHTSEESILSLRSHFSEYKSNEGPTPHLDPRLFGRALSALGGSSLFSSDANNREFIFYPRWWSRYHYLPNSGSPLLKKQKDGGWLRDDVYTTFVRFSQPSFANLSAYVGHLRGNPLPVPFVRVTTGQKICNQIYDSGCYEKVKRALACGMTNDQDYMISRGPLYVNVKVGPRNDTGFDHGNTLIGWVDKVLPTGAENEDFTEAWPHLVGKWNWTAPSPAGQTNAGAVLVFDEHEMRDAAVGILVGLEHATNFYFVPVILTELEPTAWRPDGATVDSNDPVTPSLCYQFSSCRWAWSAGRCLCRFSYLKDFTSGTVDFSQHYTNPDLDTDLDGVPDYADNCPLNYNPSQKDLDGDGAGDACDIDADGDGIVNTLDADDLNMYVGADLNQNGYYEMSLPRVHRADPANYVPSNHDDPENPDVYSDRAMGAGYQIPWNFEDFHSFKNTNDLLASIRARCDGQCYLNYTFGQERTDCLVRCGRLEIAHFPPQTVLQAYPGEYSFACVYQNYFHPKCLRWVHMLLSLEKMWTIVRDSGQGHSLVQDYNYAVIEPVISEAIGRGVKMMEAWHASPNFSNFANITLQNLKVYVNNLRFHPPSQAKLTPFHVQTLQAVFSVLNDPLFNESQLTGIERSARAELPNLLHLINPCDAVHQASLFTFPEMKQGIIDYCNYQSQGDSLQQVLCENEQLIFWKSYHPTNSSLDAMLPTEIRTLPDLETWLGEMNDECRATMPRYFPQVQAIQGVDYGIGGVGSGGKVPVYITNGLWVSFDYRAGVWSENGWVPNAWTPMTVPRVKIAGCPCVGDDSTYGRCNTRCPRTPALPEVAAPEDTRFETWPSGSLYNQLWDPIRAYDVHAYPGLDPKWVSAFGNNHLAEGLSYFKEKTIPTNAGGALFFTPQKFRDYDRALKTTPMPVVPSMDDSFRLLQDLQTGEFTARISEQLDDVGGNEITIRRAYSSTTPIDEQAYGGTLTAWVIANWIQSKIKIIPGIVEDGIWRNPLSRWSVGDWVLLTSADGATLMELGKNQVVKTITRLSSDPGVTGAAVVDTTVFKGFLLLRETPAGALTSLSLLDGRSATTVDIAGSLVGLRDATLLATPDRLLIAGTRPGRGLQVFSVLPSGEVAGQLEWPLFHQLTRVNGSPDRVLAKLGPLGAVVRLSSTDARVDGWVFLPGQLHGAAEVQGDLVFSSGGFVFRMARDFSLGSLKVYPKTGLGNGNLGHYQVAAAAAPTLIGNDKLVYTYDEAMQRWVPKDLVKKVTP